MVWFLSPSACTGLPLPEGSPDPSSSETVATADPLSSPTSPTSLTSTATTLDVSDLDPYVQPDVWVTPTAPVPGQGATVHYAGPLADGATMVLHYGFDGWSDVGGFSSETDSTGDVSWFDQREMIRGEDGVWTVDIEVPEGARALHFVTTDPTTGAWDNHDRLDYHWSVRFPYLGPWLTWGDEATAPELVVSWETSVPCLGVVSYGPTAALGQQAVGDVLGTVHHAALPALAPGESLFYRVHDSAGQASEVFEVSLPAPDATAIRFAALADMQDEGETRRWSEVAAAVADQQPELLLISGDLAWDDEPGLWWLFFDKGRELLARTPLLASVGNHDTPTKSHNPDVTSFLRYFPHADRPWASVRAGPLRVLLLSTEVSGELALGGVQYDFAAAELDACGAAPDRCPWMLVSMHVPPYNAGARHGDEQYDLRPLTALFDGRVDWVLTGHEHLYQRMRPLRFDGALAPSGSYGRGGSDGVGYLVLPPAGNWPEDEITGDSATQERLAYPIPDGSDRVRSEIGFALVEIDGEDWQIDVYGLGTLEAPAPLGLLDSVGGTRAW